MTSTPDWNQGRVRLPLASRPDLVRYVNGEPVLSAKATAYLFGVTEAEVREHGLQASQSPMGAVPWPKVWIRQGKENAARLGTDNMAEALTLLALEREA